MAIWSMTPRFTHWVLSAIPNSSVVSRTAVTSGTGNITAFGRYQLFQDTTDSDADGVLDTWEEYYFPGEPSRDLSQDFDSDTFTDLEEYLAETDPKDSGSTP